VLGVTDGRREEPVYDLTIEGAHEFFANGLLVHNSDGMGYPVHRLFPIRLDTGGQPQKVIIRGG